VKQKSWFPRHVVRSLALVAVLTVLATTVAAVGGEDRKNAGLRVNASALAALVWESLPWALAEPPVCRTRSPDGIGRWRCHYRFALNVDVEDFAPIPPGPEGAAPPMPKKPDRALKSATVRVTQHGVVRGRGLDGRPFRACCLRLR
jgi:hypothetical protein